MKYLEINVTEEKDLYTEKHKTLIKEIKKAEIKEKYFMFQISKNNIFKMSIIPKAIYSSTQFLSKFQWYSVTLCQKYPTQK
jgi:hypothetical protein